jgi:hypothetical protein
MRNSGETSIATGMTWALALPILVELLRNGSEKGRAFARGELVNMARAADLYNAGLKGKKP